MNNMIFNIETLNIILIGIILFLFILVINWPLIWNKSNNTETKNIETESIPVMKTKTPARTWMPILAIISFFIYKLSEVSIKVAELYLK